MADQGGAHVREVRFVVQHRGAIAAGSAKAQRRQEVGGKGEAEALGDLAQAQGRRGASGCRARGFDRRDLGHCWRCLLRFRCWRWRGSGLHCTRCSFLARTRRGFFLGPGCGFLALALLFLLLALAGENAAKRTAAAKNLMPLIGQAETLIDGATGSYLGAAHDQTARFFGNSTAGAQNIARLRVLEGNIMMAQPRMEGPQSNLDVELYRQMAAQIGDPTVPNTTKKAALSTLRTLYEKYDSGKPAAPSVGGGVPSDIGALLDKYGGY